MALVCLVFLWHVRSALVAIITLPIAILLSFLPMYEMQLTSNIMSLGGIAIAIGAMVDSAIIMVENAHKFLERFREDNGRDPTKLERVEVIIAAAKSVGRPLFFALLVITVSFIPVFSLGAQEGRLFKPLAFTKTFSMFFAALLGVTLVPVLMLLFIRGKITPEVKNPRQPSPDLGVPARWCNFVLRFRWLTLLLALLVMAATIYPVQEAGQGVHAAAERRGHSLYADRRPRHFHRGGHQNSADPGPNASAVSGGGIRVRQSRRGGNLDRSGPAFHVRDGGQAQAGLANGARDDLGKASGGDERAGSKRPAWPTSSGCPSRPGPRC